ncbi:helix-turn-helix domain-containing protein [Jiulongibacter sediminis]|uniref:helix-turn-helix domain-containing protein n=1 Tax=Jiulongibacter sediminis TaxID=1605367 RepID=UPI0026EE9D9F|nr:helix-turn-helix domain-containing protein [Jiulongibacter sediminis]
MTELIDLVLKLSQDLQQIKFQLQQFQKSRLERFTEAWIDGQDVMQTLHISKRTLQSLRDEGTLPFSRINGKFYYKLSDIEQLLESNYSHLNKKSNGSK